MGSKEEKKASREEKRASKNPKIAMEKEATRLISTVTHIDREEENFEICERFVLSNLLYHKFLEPDEKKVNRSLAGLQQKFLIHAQPEKAATLKKLLNSYSEDKLWQEHHDQFDIRYRLLSLLLQLAESPVNHDYSPSVREQEEEEEEVDWLAVLREGEESPPVWGEDDDTLSEWSEDEEEEEEVILRKKEHNNNSETGRRIPQHTETEEKCIQDRVEEAEKWLDNGVQTRYWAGQVGKEESTHPAARLAQEVEKQLEQAGKLGVRTHRVTEYQVIREILWMLRYPTPSPLFQLKENQFVVTSLVTIPSLTEVALKQTLQSLLPAINAVFELRLFLDTVYSVSSQPHTLEAYASGLDNILQSFSHFLFSVEADIHNKDSSLTLLAVMDRLQEWLGQILHLYTLHNLATKDFLTTENWYKSIRLLSVLYNCLSSGSMPSLLPYLLDIFLKSLQPYFTIIQTWLTEGRLEDWRQEFIFYKRDNDTTDVGEDFWNSAFLSHDYKTSLLADSISPLGLLAGLDTKILASGKSIEIMHRLDQTFSGVTTSFTDSDNNQSVLFSNFLSSLETQLPKIEKQPEEVDGVKQKLDPELKSIVDSADCPYLALSLQEIFLSIPDTNVEKVRDTKDSVCELLLPHSRVDTLLPLEPMLRRSLVPSIHSHYSRSCQTVVNLFIKDLELEAVLSRARCVFFLEAGDLMHEFCSELFHLLETVEEVEQLDSASLTLLLQDCLSGRFPSWADTFSVDYKPEDQTGQLPSLMDLSLHLRVSWPLTMVFTEANLKIYSSVFVFLAGVKRSLWALQSVRLDRLKEIEEQQNLETSSLFLSSQDVSLGHGCKQHRLQLLRSWLLYFTTTVQGYFMSRVVHSTELELREKLAAATDLDMIILVHQEYLNRIHDRCFLHPSASMLRDAVSMVLDLGLQLQQAAQSGRHIHTHTLLEWETRYARCHKFLASTLQAMTAKRKLPHLEGLAVALLHSCPV